VSYAAMSVNTLPFLLSIIRLLTDAQVTTWVFGGWVEELWQISAPRAHNDIDLLYPADDFVHVDRWIVATEGITEIAGKRFSHKRAVIYRQVMIEFLLLERVHDGHQTNFLSGLYALEWPPDTLRYTISIADCVLQVASPDTLTCYRREHIAVQQAYQMHVQQRSRSPTELEGA
jgi:hypothetical protein